MESSAHTYAIGGNEQQPQHEGAMDLFGQFARWSLKAQDVAGYNQTARLGHVSLSGDAAGSIIMRISSEHSSRALRRQSTRLMEQAQWVGVDGLLPRHVEVPPAVWDKLIFHTVRHRRSPFLLPMLHPCGVPALLWRLTMLVFDLTYTAFWVPVGVAFCTETYGDLSKPCTQADLAGGIVYLINLLVGFQMGVVMQSGGRRAAVLDGPQVAYLYARYGRLLMDVVSVVPFFLLISAIVEGPQEAHDRRLLSLLSLVRLVRLMRLVSLVKEVYQDTASGGLRESWITHRLSVNAMFLILISYQYIVAINLFACLMILISYMYNNEYTWYDSLPYVDLINARPALLWWNGIYWVITAVTTTGMGQAPRQVMEQVVSNFYMVYGMIVSGMVVGIVGRALLQASGDAAQVYLSKKKVTRVSEWASERHLPSGITRKLQTFFTRAEMHKQEFNFEANLINGLPSSLRKQVVSFIVKPLLEKVHIFRQAEPELLDLIAQLFRPLDVPEGHDLCSQGGEADRLWLVEVGTVVALRHREKEGHPTTGMACLLGEGCMLRGIMDVCALRAWTLRTTSNCRLWELRWSDLEPVLRVNPELMALTLTYMRDRLAQELGGLPRFDKAWCELVVVLLRSLKQPALLDQAQDNLQRLVQAQVEDGSLPDLLAQWLEDAALKPLEFELGTGPKRGLVTQSIALTRQSRALGATSVAPGSLGAPSMAMFHGSMGLPQLAVPSPNIFYRYPVLAGRSGPNSIASGSLGATSVGFGRLLPGGVTLDQVNNGSPVGRGDDLPTQGLPAPAPRPGPSRLSTAQVAPAPPDDPAPPPQQQLQQQHASAGGGSPSAGDAPPPSADFGGGGSPLRSAGLASATGASSRLSISSRPHEAPATGAGLSTDQLGLGTAFAGALDTIYSMDEHSTFNRPSPLALGPIRTSRDGIRDPTGLDAAGGSAPAQAAGPTNRGSLCGAVLPPGEAGGDAGKENDHGLAQVAEEEVEERLSAIAFSPRAYVLVDAGGRAQPLAPADAPTPPAGVAGVDAAGGDSVAASPRPVLPMPPRAFVSPFSSYAAATVAGAPNAAAAAAPQQHVQPPSLAPSRSHGRAHAAAGGAGTQPSLQHVSGSPLSPLPPRLLVEQSAASSGSGSSPGLTRESGPSVVSWGRAVSMSAAQHGGVHPLVPLLPHRPSGAQALAAGGSDDEGAGEQGAWQQRTAGAARADSPRLGVGARRTGLGPLAAPDWSPASALAGARTGSMSQQRQHAASGGGAGLLHVKGRAGSPMPVQRCQSASVAGSGFAAAAAAASAFASQQQQQPGSGAGPGGSNGGARGVSPMPSRRRLAHALSGASSGGGDAAIAEAVAAAKAAEELAATQPQPQAQQPAAAASTAAAASAAAAAAGCPTPSTCPTCGKCACPSCRARMLNLAQGVTGGGPWGLPGGSMLSSFAAAAPSLGATSAPGPSPAIHPAIARVASSAAAWPQGGSQQLESAGSWPRLGGAAGGAAMASAGSGRRVGSAYASWALQAHSQRRRDSVDAGGMNLGKASIAIIPY